MKILYPLTLVYISLTLISCASSHNIPQTSPPIEKKLTTPPPKDPFKVSIYHPPAKLKQPYKIIGKEIVSRYNTFGIKRQEATILDTMRQIAADMGGDAVIDVNHQSASVTATVVQLDEIV